MGYPIVTRIIQPSDHHILTLRHCCANDISFENDLEANINLVSISTHLSSVAIFLLLSFGYWGLAVRSQTSPAVGF